MSVIEGVVWTEYPRTGKWHAFREDEELSVCELVRWEDTGDEADEAPESTDTCRVCYGILHNTRGRCGWDGTGWNTDLDRGYAEMRWDG